MKQKSWVLDFLAVFFLLFGILWLVTIYNRCQVISPERQVHSGLRYSYSRMGVMRTARSLASFSSHIRPAHILYFWALASMEMMCSLLYIVGGFALFRRYKFGYSLSQYALWFDLLYKILTAAYMFLIAVPLQCLLKNSNNILLNYYLPDRSAFSDFSAFFSGLRFYYPEINFSVIVYSMYFIFVYAFIKQRVCEVREMS